MLVGCDSIDDTTICQEVDPENSISMRARLPVPVTANVHCFLFKESCDEALHDRHDGNWLVVVCVSG